MAAAAFSGSRWAAMSSRLYTVRPCQFSWFAVNRRPARSQRHALARPTATLRLLGIRPEAALDRRDERCRVHGDGSGRTWSPGPNVLIFERVSGTSRRLRGRQTPDKLYKGTTV